MDHRKWNNINQYYETVSSRAISELFKAPNRFEEFSSEACNIFLDFSKTNLDERSRNMMLDLIEASGVRDARKRMFSGDSINKTENRAVLHWLLRTSEQKILMNDNTTVEPLNKVIQRMENFAEQIRSGKIKSSQNNQFTDILNIGIGGSDLGPKMSVGALKPYHDGPRCHFIANVDSAELTDTLREIDPAKTLVIIASKTFTTLETMTNAKTVIRWLEQKIAKGVEKRLVAVSSNLEEVKTYKIAPEQVFSFPDSIGGRFSMWGPIGLSIMIAIGVDQFREFLLGAHKMDMHFLNAKNEENLPILLAMIGVWHRNVCKYSTRAILPYEHRLLELPKYLQQLDMESNGKSIGLFNEDLDLQTAPIVWGEAGTNGQHAFYQMLHQGTTIVPCEFLIGANGHEPKLKHHHDLLVANCLAQSEALMDGRKSSDEVILEKFKLFPGNRPSVTIAYPKLTPRVLGSLIALFEHRTFVEGIVWGVNSFDQWGVELGKQLSSELVKFVQKTSNDEPSNPSTAGLLSKLITMQHP